MKKGLFLTLIFVQISLIAGYKFEDIKIPELIDPQIGGMSFTPSGELAVCFHRGQLMLYNPETKIWREFAVGLHEPLGLLALSDSKFLVMQRPELTLISDSDGDGKADTYKTVFDRFGMSGNYHEFSYGPVKDKEGNLYIALSTASGLASMRKEIRGVFTPIGADRSKFYDLKNWKKHKDAVGRMYSKVPYRGCVLKITPDGKLIPFASGIRSPNGLCFDADGELFVPDNQGDWLGTSKVHHVQKGDFHGHPASLVWRHDWDGRDPLKVDVKDLEKMRKPAAALVPQGIMGNSPTQPVLVENNKFGPFKNQILIGEMNFQRILRFIKDEVDGVVQGTIIPHLDGDPLRIGNNRMAWSPGGHLYIGRSKLSWPGDFGIQKVVWDGEVDLDIQNVELLKDGFKIQFTKALEDELATDNFDLKSYHYLYQRAYGSPRIDEQDIVIDKVILNQDRKSVELKISNLRKNKVYEFKLNGIKSLRIGHFCYTLNKLRK